MQMKLDQGNAGRRQSCPSDSQPYRSLASRLPASSCVIASGAGSRFKLLAKAPSLTVENAQLDQLKNANIAEFS